MSFDFSTDGIRAIRYDGSDFIEENLLFTPGGGLDITQSAGTASFSISAATLSGNLQGSIDQNASDIAANAADIATVSGLTVQNASDIADNAADITSLSGYVNSTFVELAGDTMTGFLTLNADPTASGHAATKQYVDTQVASAAVAVKDDNVLAVASANFLDFGHALAVTSGGNEADVDVNEAEFTTVVFLTGNQTISGVKTFADEVIMESDLTVQGTTTTLNTEILLVEDNIVTLNSTVTGTPAADSGLEVERGTDTNAVIIWDESEDHWAAGLSGSQERILLESDLTAINGDITTLSGLIDQNASDIAGNTADIATVSGLTVQNASDISDNATDITTLSGLIVQNSSDISDNAADIASLSGYVDSTFVEIAGDTMTGFLTLHADPTASGHAATKQYVDAQIVSSAGITIEEDDAQVASGILTINFGSGLDVTDDGGNQVSVVVDPSEFNVVLLSGNQTISGTKTFVDPIVVASGAEPASSSDTGAEGEIRWADDYVYIAVGDNNWKRAALASF